MADLRYGFLGCQRIECFDKTSRQLKATKPLPEGESASVPATAAGRVRFLFALPDCKNDGRFPEDLLPPADATITLEGIARPASVRLLGDGSQLDHQFNDGTLTVTRPAARRTPLVGVVRVALAASERAGGR